MRFAEKVQAGVVVVNGGNARLGAAHGLRRREAVGKPAGGRRGWRRSTCIPDWKYVNLVVDPAQT